jgi:hypothetical protein
MFKINSENTNYLQVDLEKCVQCFVPISFAKMLSTKFRNIYLRNFAEFREIIFVISRISYWFRISRNKIN